MFKTSHHFVGKKNQLTYQLHKIEHQFFQIEEQLPHCPTSVTVRHPYPIHTFSCSLLATWENPSLLLDLKWRCLKKMNYQITLLCFW